MLYVRSLTIAIVLGLVFVALPMGSADFGRGCALGGGRLEGECYNYPTGVSFQGCEPSLDLEHTKVVGPSAAYSDQWAASMPSSGCGLTFINGPNGSPLEFRAYAIKVVGAAAYYRILSLIFVDGALHNMGEAQLYQGSVQRFNLDEPLTSVQPGRHVYTYAFITLAGPSTSAVELDYLEYLSVPS